MLLFSSSSIDKNTFNFAASAVFVLNTQQEPKYIVMSNKKKKIAHSVSTGTTFKENVAIGNINNALSILMNIEFWIKGFAKPKIE